MNTPLKIVVIGGVAAGPKAAARARRLDPTADITLIERGQLLDIDNPRVRLIPLDKLREQLGELPRDKDIVVFCKISLRGYEAQRILEGAGFSNVRFMDGGLLAWPYALRNSNK